MKWKQTLYCAALFNVIACGGRQIKREITLAPANGSFDAIRLKAAIESPQNEKVNIHSIVVEHHGKIIAEFYGAGSDRTMTKRYGIGNPFAGETVFDADTLHDVRSVSKSVTSLLFGLERYRNKMPGLTESVLSTYPQLGALSTAAKNQITFAHLLTMTSGLEWHEWGRSFITSDETRLLWKADPARFVFDKPVVAEPGTVFRYSGGSTAVIADTLARSAGKPLYEIARDDFFTPLEITEWEWATDSDGRPLAYAGLRLKPRDMVKIGRLLLQKGKWQGKQLVSAAWIEQALKTHVMTEINFFSGHGENLGYGYQWWTGKSAWKQSTAAWSCAVGNGGQRICVVPQLDLVIVTTAGDYGEIEIQRRVGRAIDEIIAAIR